MKKIVLFFVLIFSFGIFSGVNADEDSNSEKVSELQKTMVEKNKEASKTNETYSNIQGAIQGDTVLGNTPVVEDTYLEAEKANEEAKEARDAYCDESNGCLDKASFQINVDDISPGIKIGGKTTTQKVNWVLGTIIQKMMIALGVLSVLIMTTGSGYIILHNGQDELLSKGKTIFMSGVYAMIVALSSYYLIAIVRYLLYSAN